MLILVGIALALLAWAGSTGVILLAVRRADLIGGTALRDLCLWGLIFVAFGLVAVRASGLDGTLVGVGFGFAGALALWGWIELAFLAGVIAGPRRTALPVGLSGMDRFRAAVEVVIWHELVLLMVLFGLVLHAQQAATPMAAMVFGLLYVARVSAKLNLFYGVPGINLSAVPRSIAHVPSYFRIAPPTAMFAVSITLLSAMLAIFIELLASAASPVETVTFALLVGMAALAYLEHWMMLMPMADTKLWRWLMPEPDPVERPGKTAYDV